MPGTATLTIQANVDVEPLAVIEVKPGARVDDERLHSIEIDEFLHQARLTVFDEKREPLEQFQVVCRAAGTAGPETTHRESHGQLVLTSRSPRLDLRVEMFGIEGHELEEVFGDVEIGLRRER